MKKISLNKNKSYKIVVFGLSGIGISLLTVPMLRALRKNLSHSKLTYVVRFTQSKKLLEKCPYIDKILVCNLEKLRGIGRMLAFIWKLRRKFDISITTFPSNNRLKNIFSFAVGAQYRITHKFKVKKFTNLSFLQNVFVDVDYKAHDVNQNLNLLLPLGIDINGADESLGIYPERDYEDFACGYLASLDVKEEDILVGMHPGSSEKFGMGHKRWSVKRFAKLADKLIDKYKIRILVFGGKDEAYTKRQLKGHAMNKQDIFVIKGTNISQTASLIKKCSLFISNDTGLMHLSAAQGVTTIGIFGPTDARRTAPYGDESLVVESDLECSPCWSLENIGRRFSCIKGDMECLESLGVDEVFNFIKKNIDLSKLRESLSDI